MGNSVNNAKTKWNSKHYTQVKFYASQEIAAQFKSACASANVSMASVLTQFIAEYTQSPYKSKPAVADYWSTKRKRRKAIEEMINIMGRLRDAQENAMNNIPESFQDSALYEDAENSVIKMEEVIEALNEIY